MVRDYTQNTPRNRRLIRELLTADRQGFCSAAIQFLKSPEASPAVEYLISLLASENLLVAALCDPALNPRQALSLARAAQGTDPNVDVAIARELAANVESAGGRDRDQRLMEILSRISDGTRILPFLMRLLRHPDPYLRSKAVLLVGRGNRNVQWIRKRLAESDGRIRANAVEALWGVDTPDVRELLRSLARDDNNRVAGNALLSLYRLGDRSVVEDLVKMAGHASAAFRTTAAWVIGETGDPRFLEILAHMMNDPNVATRKRAFAALGRLKAAATEARLAGERGAPLQVPANPPQKDGG
jgi:HEAT repeat protein